MAHLAKLAVLSLALGFATSSPEPINDAELSNALVSMLVEGGHPCARVLDVRAMDDPDRFEVTCTERAGGQTIIRYIMNMRDGTAVKA